jgi:hypothetical protein
MRLFKECLIKHQPALIFCEAAEAIDWASIGGGCCLHPKAMQRRIRSPQRFAHSLIVLLVSLCVWLMQPPSALAATMPRLSLADLPTGFVSASQEEAQSCQMAGDRVAFVLRSPAAAELVCAASFSLATENGLQVEMVRQVFDSILQNPQTLVEQADPTQTKALEILDLAGIGDCSTGFSTVEAGVGRTEVLLFRRGDFINSVLVRYPADQPPIAPLRTVAERLDRQAVRAAAG